MPKPYEPEQVLQLLNKLSSVDYQTIRIIAYKLTQNHDHILGEDLLQKAISDTMSGTRSWPEKLPMHTYFFMTMRSIRSELNRRKKQIPLISVNDPRSINLAKEYNDPETELLIAEREDYAKGIFNSLHKFLEADKLALAILETEPPPTKVGGFDRGN